MAFDLSDVLKGVSGPDTGREQIEYIPLEQIDPSPDNFYSLEGLNELAGSIEMLGLQQPLLVRPAPEGRFTVISGHRRRAALLLIRDGGSAQFAAGVPCIVDRSEASAALQELKLIMANSDTRKMTSADQNTQAARIEDLLRQLEDEGFQFPGRLRDWVAKLSGMSRSKLARLKVIRDKLDPKIKKEYYTNGKINEETAYELARLPDNHQLATIAWLKSKGTQPKFWFASTIKQYGEDLQRFETYVCPKKFGGGQCANQHFLMERVWKSGYHGYCHCASGKKCCADCDELASCSQVCGHMMAKAEDLRRERKLKNKEMKAAEKAAEQPLVDRVRAFWLRFGNALGRANMEDEDLRKITGHKIYQLDSTAIASLEAGEYAPKVKAGTVLPFFNSCYHTDVDRYIKTADALDCSLDYLFLRTDVPEVNTKTTAEPVKQEVSLRHLGWLTCTPPDGVVAWAKFMGEDTEDVVMLAHYHADSGVWYSGRSASPWGEIDQKCVGWWPIPDDNALDLPADLTPQPADAELPTWHTGKPPREGLYYCRLFDGKPSVLKWHPDSERFAFPRTGGEIKGDLPEWYPLPDC